jgi:CHAT domain-containing protein
MQATLAHLHELWNEIEEASHEGREYVSLRRGSAIDFHGLRDHVRAITASSGSPCLLIEYFLTTKKLFAFLVRAEYEEPIVVTIDIDVSDVESISERRPFDEYLLASLAPVVAPISNHAGENDLVWIVPHGPLHSVPLHAVPIGNQPLINRNPVFYTPSGSVMTYCERDRPAQNGRVLVLAEPSETRPLRHVRREAEAVGAQFAESDVVLGPAATKQTFTDKLTRGRYDIVHLACHGSFEHDDPLRSGIELAGNEVVTVADVLGLRIDTGLVVLSACETGLGERRASDDLIGLTRSFIYAGSPSVVVSQWAVQDLSTAILMDNFYTGLAKGLNKAVALQQAQLQLRAMTRESAIDYYRTRPRTSTPRGDADDDLRGDTSPERPVHPYADPYYWAPFTLIGRW